MDKKIEIWMAMDPETFRVLMQNREFQDGDFPPGLRGSGWEMRKGEISEQKYRDLLDSKFSNEETDALHRDLWSDSGKTKWPGYV